MKQKELLSEVGAEAQGSKGRREFEEARLEFQRWAKGAHPQGGHRRQGGHRGYQQPPGGNYQHGGYHQGGSWRGWGGRGHW